MERKDYKKIRKADKAKERGITEDTLIMAEKIASVKFTDSEHAQILETIIEPIESFDHRRRVSLPNSLGPALSFNPLVKEIKPKEKKPVFVRSPGKHLNFPDQAEDIAFAPVTQLSRWIESGALSSFRLTQIYLERLKKIGPTLNCVVTLTEERALREAEKADQEISSGKYRGPLHGIPWGAKDLLDTANIRTTWGASPYKDRVPASDAAVVRMLEKAGAVLIAKLSLGALALGDIWFNGRTKNPWKTEQGSGGSSAGSAAATAAGLVGFSLGTETYDSIISPCMRCGTTGLRPTFGRVPRTGAMTLSWSYDKIGPICRCVEDTALVLSQINGFDIGDPDSRNVPFSFDAAIPVKGLRIGYMPRWFTEESATDIDKTALEALKNTGVELIEIEIPDLPYTSLEILFKVEAASAFEELTLTDRDDELLWQEPEAWPNIFRMSRFIPAVEYVQIQRFRRYVMNIMDKIFNEVDVLFSPSFAGDLSLITDSTGHPSLTLRAGIKNDGTPHGVTLWGNLFDEGTLCRVGIALEKELHVWDQRPPICISSI